MSMQYESRIINYTATKCPLCEKDHTHILEVRLKPMASGIVLIGATPGSATPSSTPTDPSPIEPSPWDVTLLCPNTHKQFAVRIPFSPQAGEGIIGIVEASPSPTQISTASPTTVTMTSLLNDELKEWTKASTTAARDFSKTMTTTATGAVPIFFAVLTYLGVGANKKFPLPPLLAWLGVIPPSLFLASAVVFMLAQRPQYTTVADLKSFNEFRNTRLRRMNVFIMLGTVLFVLAMLLSIVAFVLVITA